MDNKILDVIVVGGGQSGLSASYYLQQQGLQHILFERGRIGESWRSQRWDSFKLNTANKLNVLPGNTYKGNDPDGFCTAAEYVELLKSYAKQLPVVENATVLAIEKEKDVFKVVVDRHGTYYGKQVIIASGDQSEYKMPTCPVPVPQIHAGEYRNAAQLPPGAVLVVGSAQSGVQIAEELLEQDRKVFLATSSVPRVPGQYRGRDIIDWLIMMKFFDATKEEVPFKAPLLTGIGECRRTISLQSLAKKGAVLLGTFKNIENGILHFLPNATTHVQFGDTFSQRIKGFIDEFIQATGQQAPAAAHDENDEPATYSNTQTTLTINDIGSIIWATGFTANYDYLKLPVLDAAGRPIHKNGISNIAGLYFLGRHLLRTRKSGLIMGVQEDAEFIVSMATSK